MKYSDLLSHLVLKYHVIPKTPKVLPGKKHIACIGDSITFGAGVNGKTQLTWEHFLNEYLGEEYQVLNYGISGRTLQDEGDYPYKKDKFYWISLRCGAEIYMIMLGTNDAKPYNWDRERYQQELASFVGEYCALPQQPRVLLMTPPRCYDDPKIGKVAFDIDGETIDRDIAPLVREEAEGRGLAVVDLNAFTQGHPDWFGDGVHPNEIGNRQIAGYLAEQLRSLGLCRQAG